MMGLTSHHRYYLYNGVCDMRKGFDGLSGIISMEMNRNVLDGSVYLFINRRRDRMKMLVWEHGGFMLYYKRLERGQFELPIPDGQGATVMNWEVLVLMLRGLSLQQTKRRKRYNLVAKTV